MYNDWMIATRKLTILASIVVLGLVVLSVGMLNGSPSHVATSTVPLEQSTSTINQTDQAQATTSEQVESNCVTVLPIDQSNKSILLNDKAALQAASSSQEINGRSDGGGGQITYYEKNGEIPVIEQRFYGESSGSYIRFYYAQGTLFALTKLNLYYKVPIYVDKSAKVAYTEKQDYYLDENGNVCRWFNNGEEQSVDAVVKQTVGGYVQGVLKD
jgi:hypothetical protein